MTTSRLLTGTAAVLLGALALGGLAACGEQGAGGPVTTPGTSAPAEPDATDGQDGTGGQDGEGDEGGEGGADGVRAGELTVTVDDGAGQVSTWTLVCGEDGGAGGDHPDAAGACAALQGQRDPFRPVPADMMCTQVWGGPQTATVEGTWAGQPVRASFDRTDGCQIARWDRLAPLLQPGVPAGSGAGGV
ncbi:SSI family serine proteinase inhibitor [Kineococcus terrestris]|uniref:SSI family serine proteinase inhibitor n=1 Tax=Kineococcus terrestris TaxID=2044856 RepID=UPI0034DB016E